MITEVLGILGSVLNMVNSSSSEKRSQEEIDAIRKKNSIPPSLLKALGLAGEQATMGLPGYESMKEDVKTELPTTLNQIRDMAGTGALNDVLTQLYTKQNKSLRDLSISNEQAKFANKKNLQDLLSGAMANAESTQTATDMSLGLTKTALRQQGDRDQASYLNQLLGGIGKTGDLDWVKIIAGLSKGDTSVLGGKFDPLKDTYSGDIG